eukprot:CAMPEP_0181456082 /NCGR_PEP_ID=MMETSP1110-20121109/31089_1 /TAXON_ID=174948 /ORGANISM="Symbiodinium sp., Strain CCMP421" /LENGTH=74 /DNA_ID=CAMNT_0023580485 /DNA_START=239 /DNA_END=463 /DNA_ORIENTATION=-
MKIYACSPLSFRKLGEVISLRRAARGLARCELFLLRRPAAEPHPVVAQTFWVAVLRVRGAPAAQGQMCGCCAGL